MRCVECGIDTYHRWERRLPDERRHEKRERRSRGLCWLCDDRARRNGTILDYERKSRPVEEVLEEWAWLRSEGYTKRQAAERLGMKWKTFEKALARAAQRGLAA